MHKEIINKIKEKKPLDKLDDSFVEFFIEKFLSKNYKLKKKLEDNKFKKSDIETIVKNTRNILNKIYGQFWINDKIEISSHKSTIERRYFYDKLYREIFKITGKPKKILDLAAGLNYLSYSLIDKCHFISGELTDYDCDNLRKYFLENKINGEVIKVNLFNDRNFPKTDVCFLFKVLDSIDLENHKTSEELIKSIDSKWIVASFSKITINNRKMNYPKRGWFERMIGRLNLEFKKIEFENEIFYIIKKN